MFNRDGTFHKLVQRPVSKLFDEDSIYKPVAVAVDSYGRMFVVSSTTYQGIIVMNDDGDFNGFIGAQKVSLSALEIFRRKFLTKEQRETSETYVSTEFNNIAIDSDNFIYVTISSIDEEDVLSSIKNKDKSGTYAPVKKLNASGKDVMARNGFYPPSGEVAIDTSTTAEFSGVSTLVDVAVGPEGTWSIIDQKRSKIFTYDKDGNLLFAFGDVGSQTGNIKTAKAIVYQGDNLLVLDSTNDNICVYRRTEYGDTLIRALKNQNDRLYDVAVDDWYEILKRNNNFDAAYIGIGKSFYRNGDYETSLEYYKAAVDVEDYSTSFGEMRKIWANKWFWTIPLGIVAVCFVLVKFFGYANKVNSRASLKMGRKSIKEEILYAFYLIFHPFDAFWDLKHEYRGSVKSAFLILLATIVTFFYQSVGTGYIFSPDDSSYMNILTTLLSVGMPLILWVVANWCLTTLFEGEGSLKDIFISTCYSLTPLILLVIPSVLLSNVLVLEEEALFTFLQTLAFVWTGILLVFGTMVTHDYSFGKNILTIVGTIVGMAFIMFVGILFSTLVAKMISFVSNLVIEFEYRM